MTGRSRNYYHTSCIYCSVAIDHVQIADLFEDEPNLLCQECGEILKERPMPWGLYTAFLTKAFYESWKTGNAGTIARFSPGASIEHQLDCYLDITDSVITDFIKARITQYPRRLKAYDVGKVQHITRGKPFLDGIVMRNADQKEIIGIYTSNLSRFTLQNICGFVSSFGCWNSPAGEWWVCLDILKLAQHPFFP